MAQKVSAAEIKTHRLMNDAREGLTEDDVMCPGHAEPNRWGRKKNGGLCDRCYDEYLYTSYSY